MGERTRSRIVTIAAVAVFSLMTAPNALGAAPGFLDSTFGNGGVAPTAVGGSAIALGPDGSSLFIGGGELGPDGFYQAAVSRFTSSGVPDPTYGVAGTSLVQMGTGVKPESSIFSNSLSVLPDGSVVAGGLATLSDVRALGVERLLPNGSADLNFNASGTQRLQFVPSPGYLFANGTAAGPGGTVYGTGTTEPNPMTGAGRKLFVARFTSSGAIDPSFNGGSPYQNDFSQSVTNNGSYGLQILPRPDGSSIVIGVASDATGAQAVLVAKLTADGTLDPAFGTTSPGSTVIQAGDVGGSSQGRTAALGPDGKIYVAGPFYDSSFHQAMGILRLTQTGQLDTTFGAGGVRRVQTSAGATPSSSVNSIVFQANGRILLVGGSAVPGSGNSAQIAVVRLLADGSVDPSFASNGVLLSPLAPYSYAAGGLLTSDGKLDVVGSMGPKSGTATGFLARYVVDLPPTPAFTISPASPAPGQTITLDASASADPDGTVTQIAWDLSGNGQFTDASGAVVSTSFGPGQHTVAVRLTDDDQLQAVASRTITVASPAAAAAVPSPPPPPATASLGGVTISGMTATLTLLCRGASGQTCDGSAALNTRERLRGAKPVGVSARKKSKRIKLRILSDASGSYSVPAGQSAKLKLTLNATARKLLKRFKRLPATVALSGKPSGSVTFKAAKKTKRKR